jgi:hypothetical protein
MNLEFSSPSPSNLKQISTPPKQLPIRLIQLKKKILYHQPLRKHTDFPLIKPTGRLQISILPTKLSYNNENNDNINNNNNTYNNTYNNTNNNNNYNDYVVLNIDDNYTDNDDDFQDPIINKDKYKSKKIIKKDKKKNNFVLRGKIAYNLNNILQMKRDIKYKYEGVFRKNTFNMVSCPKKTRNRAQNLKIVINKDIETDIHNSKDLLYLNKSDQSKNAFFYQNLQFLSYCLEEYKIKKYVNLINLMKLLVQKKDDILCNWERFLRSKNMSEETIRGRIMNIITLYKMINIPDNSVILLINNGKKIIKHCEYNIKQKYTDISTEDYMQQGLLPKKLKKDLLRMWNVLLPLLQKLMDISESIYLYNLKYIPKIKLPKASYILIIKILLFGFWAESTNGRCQAIVSLTKDKFKELCKNNFYTSKETKSVKIHGDQIVHLSSNSMLRLQLQKYVKYVRPTIKPKEGYTEIIFLK